MHVIAIKTCELNDIPSIEISNKWTIIQEEWTIAILLRELQFFTFIKYMSLRNAEIQAVK